MYKIQVYVAADRAWSTIAIRDDREEAIHARREYRVKHTGRPVRFRLAR
jgi:hypothetical protein